MTHTQEQMVTEVLDHESKLSDWETNFIDSISDQEYELTSNQKHTLNTIYKKVVFN